ncbi:DegT/DnrJ/EryC1/StrS family aminotransferase [Opitutales bacterium ASA1]|uniref:DegT/DnrJ/EryC1/StrS family aminotransferase n=1 Tax=Congregicoccus parvus TaxID=3081749 RepID=UPI002B2E32BF|nr:DegT/DnrJ/EryC1/StrS family aminotransferase [Opitutales bacterium ASA1]
MNPAEDPSRLAIEGGPRCVTEPDAPRRRWGERELARLRAMVKQESLFYWNGPQTLAMLDEFRRHYPLAHAMPCSSGSAALHIAVASLRLPPGSEVIVPAITDMGSVIGILYQQLVPVFADVDPASGNIAVDDVRTQISSRTRAIMAVHLAGTPCDIDAVLALATENKLRVIEDCAQAWGARHRGRSVGLEGDLAAYSFNDYKHLSCGDGGIVASNDADLGPDLRKWGDKFYDRVGGGRNPTDLAPNYRMSEPQAAVCVAQLERLPGIAERRISIGRRLDAILHDAPGVAPMHVREGDESSRWFYFFRLVEERIRVDRLAVVAALRAEGVHADAGYIPVPVYRYDVFQNHAFFAGAWPLRDTGATSVDYRDVRCPQAEAFLADTVLVRIHEDMTDAVVDGIGQAIVKVMRHYARL